MRITLIHNPGAGDGDAPKSSLLSSLDALGYDPIYVASSDKRWKRAVREAENLVVVAGGDGTVARVARRMAESMVPIAIIPIGTANNIATSLGARGVPPAARDGSANVSVQTVDLGRVDGPTKHKTFIESVGCGFFAEAIVRHRDAKRNSPSEPASTADAIEHARGFFAGLLKESRPIPCHVQLDDEVRCGEYLMVEVMNIRQVGPGLCLAPTADPCDGYFDVVVVSECERAAFEEFVLEPSCWTQGAPSRFPTYRARKVVLEPLQPHRLHIDDRAWPKDPERRGFIGRVSLEVMPGALRALT